MNMPRHTSCCHGYGSWSYVHASFTCAASLRHDRECFLHGVTRVPTSRACTFSGENVGTAVLWLVEYKTRWNDTDAVSKTAPWWPCSSALLRLPLLLFEFYGDWQLLSVILSPWAALSPFTLPEMFLNVAACMSSENHLWYLNGYRCILPGI